MRFEGEHVAEVTRSNGTWVVSVYDLDGATAWRKLLAGLSTTLLDMTHRLQGPFANR